MSDLVKPAVLFSEAAIEERIQDIGRRITADYQGREVAMVGILKGTIVFMADLIRAVQRPLTCDFLKVESTKDQRIDVAFSPETDFREREVLLLQDVVDTGVTLNFITGHIQEDWKPRSLRIAALIDREDQRKVDCTVDYACFKPTRDGFVVGYGLDSDEHYRGLPYLGILEKKRT
ncbi:MAG TPA: phosphoribosyltransferase family protein [Vicinamibacteria bacterium]|nr:phosphoribosyltransferase family protein [Vicinamibacteria bacterium]